MAFPFYYSCPSDELDQDFCFTLFFRAGVGTKFRPRNGILSGPPTSSVLAIRRITRTVFFFFLNFHKIKIYLSLPNWPGHLEISHFQGHLIRPCCRYNWVLVLISPRVNKLSLKLSSQIHVLFPHRHLSPST